jgi:transcriptional regulator of arginine metabolism
MLCTAASAGARGPLAEVQSMVRSVRHNGALVVLHTHPGAAPAVARAIDLGGLPGCLGSVAGDDTVFVAPSRASGAAALCRLLSSRLLPEVTL